MYEMAMQNTQMRMASRPSMVIVIVSRAVFELGYAVARTRRVGALPG